METERVCLDCGGPIGPGRADKKFCSPACKTNYNNEEKRKQRDELPVKREQDPVAKRLLEFGHPDDTREIPVEVTRVEQILKRNRDILEGILGDDDRPRRMKVRNLEGEGFNFKYFTSQSEPTKIDKFVYRFVFEYGYRIEPDNVILLIYRPSEIGIKDY